MDIGICRKVGWCQYGRNNRIREKYYKLLIGETFHCYDITLNELLIIMNEELNINTLSLQKSGRHNFYCRVDDKTKQYYLRKFGLLDNDHVEIGE